MIRQVTYVDLPQVRAFERRAAGEQSAKVICAPPGPVRQVSMPATAVWPFRRPSQSAWLCEENWKILGLVQVETRGASVWDLRYLACHTSLPPHEDDVLAELLLFVAESAIQHRVTHIFTRLAEGDNDLVVFTRSGFQPYARELTLVRSGPLPTVHAPDIEALRRWQPADEWGLYRLYQALAPRLVQVAENFHSDDLADSCVRTLRRPSGMRGALRRGSPLRLVDHWRAGRAIAYVVDYGVRLGGWVQASPQADYVELQMMAHPENPDVARPLLVAMLATLNQTGLAGERAPIVARVREYDGATLRVLAEFGFEEVACHTLLVRHTVTRVRVERGLVPVLEQAM